MPRNLTFMNDMNRIQQVFAHLQRVKPEILEKLKNQGGSGFYDHTLCASVTVSTSTKDKQKSDVTVIDLKLPPLDQEYNFFDLR